MNCPDESRWTDLAVGQMPFVDALRLRFHAARCPNCARTMAETRRVVAHFAAPRRRSAAVPVLALGATALAGIAAVALLPGSPTNPSVTFARVEAAMATVKTARWTTLNVETPDWMTRLGRQNREKVDVLYHNWLRLDPPAMAARSPRPHGLNAFIDANSLVSETTGPPRLFVRSDPWVSVRPFRPHGNPRQWLIDMLLFPKDYAVTGGQSVIVEGQVQLRTRVNRTAWVRHNVVLDGRPALRFDSQETYEGAPIPPAKTSPVPPGAVHSQVWVDPSSLRVLRKEREFWQISVGLRGERSKTLVGRVVDTGFVYDETPPPGTFVITPPRVGEAYKWYDTLAPRDGGLRSEDRAALRAAIAAKVKPYRLIDLRIGTNGDYIRRRESDPFPPVVTPRPFARIGFDLETVRSGKVVQRSGSAMARRAGNGLVVERLAIEPAPRR